MVLTVIGRDRPGIVARMAKVLYQNRGNIEELSQTVIKGQFAMILIATVENEGSLHRVNSDFAELGRELGLDLNMKKIRPEELAPYDPGETEPFVITARGDDRPGLVYGISEVLAERGINITNLDAKVARIGEKLEYIQLFEVDIPSSLDSGLIQEKLRQRGQDMGVTVDLQHRNIFRAINQI